MFNVKNFSKLSIVGLFVVCCTFSFNAFADDPKGNVHSELGGPKSAFTIPASRRNGLRNEETNSSSDSKTKDPRVDETQGNETCECKTPIITSSRKDKQKKFFDNSARKLQELYFDSTLTECDKSIETTNSNSSQEKPRRSFDALISRRQELYSDPTSTECDKSIEATNSNSSNVIVLEVSDVRERYNDYIRSTTKGQSKQNTLEKAGIYNAERLEEIIKDACKTGKYYLKERDKTQYGVSFNMGIDLDDDYVLQCGVFCDEKEDASGEACALGTDLDIDGRSTPLEINSSVDSPKLDSFFGCTSDCERGESLSQCCSPYLGGYSDSIDSPFINYNSDYSTERTTPITPTEPRLISPRLITVWSGRKSAAFKRNNVVMAKNDIYQKGLLSVKKGTFGLVIRVDHNKYRVLFVSERGESTIAEDISSSDLKFKCQSLKKW